MTNKRMGKKLATFDFFGFTHYLAQDRKDGLKLGRKTIGKRMRRTLAALNDKLRNLRNMLPFDELYKHL